MIIISIFMLGFLAGVLTIAAMLTWQIRKLDKKEGGDIKKQIESIQEKIETVSAVKSKFAEIDEISKEQHELISHIERPSASASHSRHKNGIINRIKDLETKKVALFQAILDLGVDPMVTMYIDGEPKEIKMSEALLIKREAIDDQPMKTDSKNPHGNSSHLTLVQNEETTDESNPSNPKIH